MSVEQTVINVKFSLHCNVEHIWAFRILSADFQEGLVECKHWCGLVCTQGAVSSRSALMWVVSEEISVDMQIRLVLFPTAPRNSLVTTSLTLVVDFCYEFWYHVSSCLAAGTALGMCLFG